MMSVNHESAFGGYLGAKSTSFGQENTRTSLDFDIAVVCGKERSSGVVSRSYH